MNEDEIQSEFLLFLFDPSISSYFPISKVLFLW